jgi:hypothetical protein
MPIPRKRGLGAILARLDRGEINTTQTVELIREWEAENIHWLDRLLDRLLG